MDRFIEILGQGANPRGDAFLGTERYRRRDFWQRRALDAERARSDRLLLNVLPEPVAARLKAAGVATDSGANGLEFADPWGTRIRLVKA